MSVRGSPGSAIASWAGEHAARAIPVRIILNNI